MKALIATLAAVVALALSASAFADPSSPDNGCHGYYTTQAKATDRGAQGEAIGGRGNSDGNPDNGQAHSAAGRGDTLQAFLGSTCQVGSQK